MNLQPNNLTMTQHLPRKRNAIHGIEIESTSDVVDYDPFTLNSINLPSNGGIS